MFDQPQQRDNKRKHDQSSSDHNKRQKFDQDNSSQFVEIEENKVVESSKKVRTSSHDYQLMEIDVEPESGPSQQSSDRQGNNESRGPDGLLRFYHGVDYQVQWLMIVALESIKHGVISGFKFKTEDNDAGKFDDVVWQYEGGGQKKYNFLQAKHTLKANERITITDLLLPKQKNPSKSDKTDTRPFSLEKYFISYLQIKENTKYQNEKNKEQVESLIIVTNIDLDENLKNRCFEKPKSKIPVLEVINNSNKQNKQPNYWKIKDGILPEKEKIEHILEGTYDLIKLARKLAECVINNQPTDISKDTFLNSYSKALKEYVIDIQANKFFSGFIKGDSPSNQVNCLSKAFLREGEKKTFYNKMESLKEGYIISQPKKLAEIIATKIESLIKSKESKKEVAINRVQSIKELNIDQLAGYVLIEKDGIQFNPKFWTITDNDLPDSFKDFRNELKSKLKSSKNLRPTVDALIADGFKEYKFKIKEFKTCKEILVDNDSFLEGIKNFNQFTDSGTVTYSNDLPNSSLKDIKEDIKGFFNKLVFAVNYSKESLRRVVEHELGKEFGLINNDYIARAFRVEIAKALDLTEETFISTAEHVSQFFDEARQQSNRLILIGPTLVYLAKIEEFGIAFSEGPSGLSNFLDFDFDERQIFNLISPHKTILSAIKVCQTLRDIPEYQRKDSYIFLRLSTLLRIKDLVIEAFKSSNLLVIECKAAEENVDELYHQLSEVTQSNKNKKIILITQENDFLAGKFKFFFSVKYEENKDEKNSLTDLTVKSQEKILKNKHVTFQGETVSLGELIDQKSKHIIDEEVLCKVIEEKGIKIGSNVPQKSDRGSPAYNIIIPQEIKIERFKDEDIKNNLFVISEVKEERLKNLGIAEEKICSFENCDLYDRNTKQFFVLNSKDRDKNIEDFETVCHNYPDKMIHFIEFKYNKFMRNRYYDPKFYTKREFYQIEIDATKLSKYATKKDEKKDIFAVSGITKEDFEKTYKIDKKVIASYKDGNLDSSKPIIILSNGDEEIDLKDFNIHWLESRETKLFWKRSKGKTSELSMLVVSKPDLTHNSLLDIVKDTRSAVIAGLSGMGKSTTLTLLTESYKKDNGLDWVIRVNLRNYSSEIDKLLDECDLQEVVKFFSAIDKEGLEDIFAKNLFKHKLEEEDNILLLFDGFDEISSGQKEGDTGQSADKQKKITGLLKFLKDKTKARIVVTTRPYEKEKTSLENELSVLSYTFKSIENEHQEFLKNFWERSFKFKYGENEIKESQYGEFAQGLIRKFNEAVNKEKSRFMGIPLHLRMLAEVHLEKFEKNDDFKDLNTFDLYKEFVDRKYKIYFSEKTGLSSTGVTNADLSMLREQYQKMHKRLAFKYLFSGSTEPFKLFFSAESERSSIIENKMPNEETTRELNRIGITQSRSKNDIDFIHRTFADYFVSMLICERLKQKLENPNYSQESRDAMRKFLLNHVFIKEDNDGIRSFINSKLADKSANLENFWSSEIDPPENKEQLLLAVKEGLGNIFSFLLHSQKDEGINKELISVPRKYIKKLCDMGKYTEADLFIGNALGFLKKLEKYHLEIAVMQSYMGNSYGTLAENTKDKSKREELFKKKKEFLEKALSTFIEHLNVANKGDVKLQEDYLQQALSTFKEDFKSIEAQTTKDPDKNHRKEVWIRVLEIQIAKVKRNLAVAYGDLGNLETKKELLKEALNTFEKYEEELEIAEAKRNLGNTYGEFAEFFEKKEMLLEEALSTFKILEKELRIAETKRNLGNVYGKLAKFENDQKNKEELLEKRKKFLEEALPYLKKHYGLLNLKVTRAQINLGKAYEALGYPLHGAVIAGNYKKVDVINDNFNRQTKHDLVTPLHLAVREGHLDIVKLLLEKQVDPNIKDKNEETPLDLAKKQNQLEQNPEIYQKIIESLET